MKVFLIDIRDGSADEEYQMCLEVLTDYFNKHHIDFFRLTKNKYSVHPSWLKLKCFDYVDDDFVLCWDLDLLPKKNTPSIVNDLDLDKINLVMDSTLILKNQPKWTEKFKYNCGLIGIPNSYKKQMEEIFETYKDSDWPSYEQYHVNKFLYQNNLADVHELDKGWNCIWHSPAMKNQFILSAKAIHITGLNMESAVKKDLINLYHDLYFQKALTTLTIASMSKSDSSG